MKIFRRDPQLAPNVADFLSDVANTPISRAEMKRQKQQAAFHGGPGGSRSSSNKDKGNHNEAAAKETAAPALESIGTKKRGSDTVRSQMDTATSKKLLWAKVIASKAQAENTNIAKRMGKMEELEKQALAMLVQMRPVIGPKVFEERVQSVLAAFPDFATYNACVDVIDVDAVLPSVRIAPVNEAELAPANDEDDIINGEVPPAAPGVPHFVHVAPVNEAELAQATNDEDDDISGEEPMDDVLTRTHTLAPVINYAALNAEGGDFTDEEWATYLKVRKNTERRERAKENSE